MTATTEDTVYQGRVKLMQPLKGFRAGSDSLLLAAALAEKAGGTALELGCGCGGALLPAAFRMPGMRFTGVEIDAGMAALAEALPCPVLSAEEAGWRGDSIEAEAFAFLAARTVRGLPISWPTTTGVPAAMKGGRVLG